MSPLHPTCIDVSNPEDAARGHRVYACGPECPLEPLDGEENLRSWWLALSVEEIDATVPKAIEYGATDLIDIGSQLGRFMKRPLTDAQAAELGCWFYLVGKLARATSALERGDWPSDDTIKDTGIYIKMIQRIRATGGWPTGGIK